MPTLQFKGKTFVQNHHLAVKYHQLVPKKELSLTDKISLHDNLIIQGDNLKALKALLPTYAGRIKCIYIDPPYNTGNENWVYNDNVNSPMIKDWLGKVVDKEDLTKHDKWLCMMMPRLKLLRELLTEDGVIFISIDDNEVHHLKFLMNEIFSEDNFVAELIVIKSKNGIGDKKGFSTNHDYILSYQKSEKTIFQGQELTLDQIEEYDKSDGFGKYKIDGLFRKKGSANKREDRPKMFYPLYYNPITGEVDIISKKNLIEVFPKREDNSDGRWTWGSDTCKENLFRLHAGKNGTIYIKNYLKEDQRKKTKTLLDKPEYLNDRGTIEIKEIFTDKAFDTVKPINLIKALLENSTSGEDIILDSFAGSGTTAHAVLELNKEDGGNRKFILVEQEDYANTITAERVRRVIKGVKTAKNENLKNGLGGTFSYFELGPTIEMESILQGKNLPSYEEFARYIFYTATGEEFNEKKINEKTGFIGETKNYELYMFYKPDVEWLKRNALTLDGVKAMPKFKGKQRFVFAPAKYVDDYTCLENRIDFCQLPYEIYRIQK